jgi:hypothetical protein
MNDKKTISNHFSKLDPEQKQKSFENLLDNLYLLAEKLNLRIVPNDSDFCFEILEQSEDGDYIILVDELGGITFDFDKSPVGKYRFEEQTGTLYEFDDKEGVYLFAVKANGRSEAETIADYEAGQNEIDLFANVDECLSQSEENELFID